MLQYDPSKRIDFRDLYKCEVIANMQCPSKARPPGSTNVERVIDNFDFAASDKFQQQP